VFQDGIEQLPSLLGIAGTAELFYGCVLLIREMRLAQRAVDSEMEFTLRLGTLYQARHGLAPGLAPSEDLNPWERLRRLFEREVKGDLSESGGAGRAQGGSRLSDIPGDRGAKDQR
jgi:hypothetical protein